MTTKILVLFYASAMAAAIAGEAPSVSGSVKDPQGRPVVSAAVSLFSRSSSATMTTTSDSQGAYRIQGVAAGDYLLRAEAPGFAVYLEERLQVDSPVSREIALQVAGVREQVVVTAAGTSQAFDEVSKSVAVIDRTEAAERDVASLTEAVDLAPAVRVQTLGGPGQEASIHIRGMRDIDTAVIVDGMRLRDAAILHGDATGLIEDLLFVNPSRVEVLNGAGSSLYGTSAVGGVVNIVTDEGGGRTRGSVLTEGGSLGTMRGRAQVAGGAFNERLQYSAGLAYVNVLEGVDGDDPFRDTSAQGSMSYRLTNTTLLRARVFGGDSFAKNNSSPLQMGTVPATGIVKAVPFVTFLPGADDPDSTRAARFLNASLTLEGQPLAKLNYSLSYQTLASSRRYGDGPAGSGYQPLGNQRSVYDGRIQTLNAQLHYQPSTAHLFTAGYEFEGENYAFDFRDASDPGAASGVSATQKSNALFLQDQTRWLGGRLLITGGFRAQYFSLDRPDLLPLASAPYQGAAITSPPAAYTGDGSVAYFFRKSNTKLRGHVGRGYRAPSLYERFGSGFDSTFGYTTYGDPRLAPEHSISFDSGVDQTFAKGRVRASASYFYNSLQQVIAFATLTGPDPFDRFLGYYNSRGGISRGIETKVTLEPIAAVNFSASYTYVNAVERAPVASAWRTLEVPRHQFSAALTWRAGKRMLFTFDTLDAGNYLGPLFSDVTFSSRAYSFDGLRRVNAGASYRLPLSETRAVRFFVRGENLLNQNYFENGFRTPGRTMNGGIQFEF
ncbi:MAG: TonB-dependent receptor [Acidobacteriota bacterium]|nr:TonB-dependent receptor [Acidobacteriota bacterium]